MNMLSFYVSVFPLPQWTVFANAKRTLSSLPTRSFSCFWPTNIEKYRWQTLPNECSKIDVINRSLLYSNRVLLYTRKMLVWNWIWQKCPLLLQPAVRRRVQHTLDFLVHIKSIGKLHNATVQINLPSCFLVRILFTIKNGVVAD